MNTTKNAHMMFSNSDNTSITAVSFHHSENKGKHYIHYGAVKGSKRIRRELDMPCSQPIYDTILKHIAQERHTKHPVITEIIPMEDTTVATEAKNKDIYDALTQHDGATHFWENAIHSYGLHDCSSQSIPVLPSFLEDACSQIQSGEVMKNKHYHVYDENDGNKKHRFTLSCRFPFTPYSDVVIYTREERITKQALLSLEIIEQVWETLNTNIIQHPEFLWNVPHDVFLNEYDK